MDEYVISVDLGGTNVRVGIVKNDCSIVKVIREQSIKNDKIALAEQICSLIKEMNHKEYNVTKVGVSACGFIFDNNIALSPNLGISNLNLKSYIEERFDDLKVEVRNDANATALSESLFGSSKHDRNSFFLTISSGIGGGLIYNHELIDLPFEIGHIYLTYKNKPLDAEKFLSGNGLKYLCNDNDLIVENAAEFFNLVREENFKAIEILNYWIDQLAQFIANIQILYNCDTIVLSGGVMKSQDLFIDELKIKVIEYISRFPLKIPAIKLAYFDQDAGLMGGAAVAYKM